MSDFPIHELEVGPSMSDVLASPDSILRLREMVFMTGAEAVALTLHTSFADCREQVIEESMEPPLAISQSYL